MKIVSFSKSHLTSFNGVDATFVSTQKQDYIKYLASYEPNTRFSNVSKNVAKTLILIPFLDTAASFLAKKGLLSAKTKSAAIASAVWATAFATGALVNETCKQINNNKFFDDFSKKHPVVTSMTKFGAMYALFIGALHSVPKLKSLITDKFPEKVQAFKEHIVIPAKNMLNKSKINSKIIQPLNIIADKHPVMSKNLRISAKLVAPIVLLSSIFRFVAEAKKRNENIANNIALLNAFDSINNTKV